MVPAPAVPNGGSCSRGGIVGRCYLQSVQLAPVEALAAVAVVLDRPRLVASAVAEVIAMLEVALLASL